MRNVRFDVVRVIAIFFVVCIHSMALIDAAKETGNISARLVSCMMGIIYCGVPLFVMLSGALLLGKEEPMKVFFKKRMSRVLIPFIVWSIIVGAILYFQGGGRSIGGYLLYTLKGIGTTGVHGIYWYVYMIIGLYCLTPVLRHILHCSGKSGGGILLYLCVLCLIVAVLGNAFPELYMLSHWVSKNLTMLFYFMTGYLISYAIKTTYRDINYKRLFSIMFIAFYVISVFMKYYGVVVPGISILLSISLFGFLLTRDGFDKMPVIVCDSVQAVSKYSYGIYLSHFMLISAIVATGVHSVVPLWIEPIMMAVTVLMVMAVIMCLLDKMKLGKYVF